MPKEDARSHKELAFMHAQRLIPAQGLVDKYCGVLQDAVEGEDVKNPLFIFNQLNRYHNLSGGILNCLDQYAEQECMRAIEAYGKDVYLLRTSRNFLDALSSWVDESQEVQLTNSPVESEMWGVIKNMFGAKASDLFGEPFKNGIRNGRLELMEELQAPDVPLLPYKRGAIVKIAGSVDNPIGFGKTLKTSINGVGLNYFFLGRSVNPHMSLVINPVC